MYNIPSQQPAAAIDARRTIMKRTSRWSLRPTRHRPVLKTSLLGDRLLKLPTRRNKPLISDRPARAMQISYRVSRQFWRQHTCKYGTLGWRWQGRGFVTRSMPSDCRPPVAVGPLLLETRLASSRSYSARSRCPSSRFRCEAGSPWRVSSASSAGSGTRSSPTSTK